LSKKQRFLYQIIKIERRKDMELFKRLWNDEEGQGMVEYGLIIALISIVVIALLTSIGGGLQNIFQQVVDALP